MPAMIRHSCRVEYRSNEIVIRGPAADAQREAHRIIRRFACSATPYRLVSAARDEVILRPA